MADLALAKFSVAISSTHHDVDVDDDEDEDDDVWANCGLPIKAIIPPHSVNSGQTQALFK